MTAEELLERCAAGERRFIEIDLSGIDLSGANLPEIDLTRCNLSNTNFSNAILIGGSLIGSNLTGANFSKANLEIWKRLLCKEPTWKMPPCWVLKPLKLSLLELFSTILLPRKGTLLRDPNTSTDSGDLLKEDSAIESP